MYKYPIFSIGEEISLDKAKIRNNYIKSIMIKILDMFEYDGLPETIPKKNLELILINEGFVWIEKVNDELYAFRTQLGGKPNTYYEPTLAVVANPAQPDAHGGEIDNDGVLILNDPLYKGLLIDIAHVSDLLAECDISFKFAAINTRIPALVEADTDDVVESAKEFFKKIKDGTDIGVISGNIISKLSSYDYASSQYMIQHLIELKQYIIGTFYQDIGIKSAYNMKRETLTKSEINLNDDVLRPTIDQMLEQRIIGVEKVNKKFGTKISVRLKSVWKDTEKENNLALENLELQNEEIKSEIVANTKEEVENEENKD